jgi:acetyl-CoA carboxylase/biotin carboxylase 1
LIYFADALRVDAVTTKAAPVGKRMSIVAGADSLGETVPSLSEIGSMRGNETYSAVALRARKLLLQESLPSIEQRKSQIKNIVETLKDAVYTNNLADPAEIADFVKENVPMSDVLYPLLRSFSTKDEQLALTEVTMRKLYNSQTLKDFNRDASDGLLKFTFVSKESESVFSTTTPVTSMTDLTRAISRSSSMQKLGDASDSESEGLLRVQQTDQVPPMTPRIAVCKLIDSIDSLKSTDIFEKILASYPQYSKTMPKCEAGPVNIMYIVVTEQNIDDESEDSMALMLQEYLSTMQYQIEQADIRRISFIFNNATDDTISELPLPVIFTYRNNADFKEDSLFRNIEPSMACQLELHRLSKNFSLQRLNSQQTATCNVHSYKATPRKVALSKDPAANKAPRIFVRALSFVLEFSSNSFEQMLVDALNALDISVHENGHSTDNHLFLNLVSDFERTVLDPVVIEQAIVTILKRHGDRVSALGLTQVETKLVCCLSPDSPPIALRMVASNPTGYVQVMNTYVEAADGQSSTPIFKLIGGTKASLASSGDGSWEGMKVTLPYPLTKPFDGQRKAALRASDSLYCYDLPGLFEAAVEQQWSDLAAEDGHIPSASRPLMVTYTSELVVQHKSESKSSWTMQDYLDGHLELTQVQRGAGANNVGMVAWLMTLRTVEYPNVSTLQELFF